MEIDRRLFELGAIIDDVLSGRLTGPEAARMVKEAHWVFQDGLSRKGASTMERLFLRAFWAIVLLDEPSEHRTNELELQYLRQCITDPSAFSEEGADRPYFEESEG